MSTSNNAVPYMIKDSKGWTAYTMLSFVVSACMMAGGIYSLEASFAAKGFYAMAAIMLVHTAVCVTKTLRDIEEASRFFNRLDDAKTEKLLMDVHRAEGI
jgi:hypothetical protein